MKDTVSSFLATYQNSLTQSIHLPPKISEQYELFDCLCATDTKSTYLVRSKADGAISVLKVALKSAQRDLQQEYQILSAVHSPAFPEAVYYGSDGQRDYLIRSYIVGFPVSHYVEKFGPFSEAEATRLIIELCRSLHLLHAQTPPIIHRDIKPQNVIFTSEHRLALIDFDTVRHYRVNQSKDTTFLGTETTAAPEQFGYKQTDQRSDIYSTGILLLYLCTGSYELDESASIHNRKLAKIIETCTQFDPDRRFSSIRLLQAQLEKSLRDEKRSLPSFVFGVVIGLAAGCGLALSLYTAGVFPLAEKAAAVIPVASAASPAADHTGAIIFDSPQIERAVRDQLGFGADTPITQSDLDQITQLFIFGYDALGQWSEVENYCLYHSSDPSGSILSLSDIPKLRNLIDLAICNQYVVDLSPLQGMPIVRLALGTNRISDLSVLTSLPNLTELFIGKNPITSIEPLRNCKHLRTLDLSDTSVVDLSPISKQEIERLYLSHTPVDNYEILTGLPSLQLLSVTDLNSNDIKLVSGLTQLTDLHYRGPLTEIDPLLKLTNLSELMLLDTRLTSLEGVDSLTKLEYILLDCVDNIDPSPLIHIPHLSRLDIIQQHQEDYSFLFQLKDLETLYCTAEQKSIIESMGQPVLFDIYVI